MMSRVMLIVIASIISAVLYRMGGSGNYPRQARVVGCSILQALCFLLFCRSWWILLTIPLTIASISTYWDFILREDNFYAHGFFIGLSAFPLVFSTIPLWLILLRAVVLALFMGLWCKFWTWDIAEETGRGAVIPLSLLLLTIKL